MMLSVSHPQDDVERGPEGEPWIFSSSFTLCANCQQEGPETTEPEETTGPGESAQQPQNENAEIGTYLVPVRVSI